MAAKLSVTILLVWMMLIWIGIYGHCSNELVKMSLLLCLKKF